MSSVAPLPNFIIIGAGKSGTTSLAHQLGQHPDIFMSDPKEPHFFSIEWDRGVGWYRRIFAGAGDCRAIGEASATYTLYPEFDAVPERMREVLAADTRFIYIVRHPVERMLSHCQHDKLAGLVADDVPYTALLGEEGKYFRGSCYATQLQRYTQVFGPDHVRVVVFESYARDPQAILREICAFLGVDTGFTFPDTTPQNVSAANRRLPGFIRRVYRVREWPLLGPVLRTLARRSGVKSLINRVAGRTIERPQLTAAEYKEYYRRFLPEIRRLSDMTGLDLAAIWSPDGAEQARR